MSPARIRFSLEGRSAMNTRVNLTRLLSFVGALGMALPAVAQKEAPATNANVKSYDQSWVGDGDPQRIVVPTNQVLSPLGRQVGYGGRPTDLALSPDGRWLAVLDRAGVLIIDPVSAQIVSRQP